MNESINNVWIQPGTRLHMLVYKEGKWQVWIATNSRVGNSDAWCGTYMELHHDGTCMQHYRSETDIRSILVRGPNVNAGKLREY